MNDVYFACRTCKTYHDCGYRWCYWTLEEVGIVERGKPVDLGAVLNASEYWNGAETEAWLRKLLPKVRFFLDKHKDHDLIYGEDYHIGFMPVTDRDWDYLDWMNEDQTPSFDLKPRDFVEKLGFRDWKQVTEYVTTLERKPTWWHFPADRVRAKKKFEYLSAR